MTRLCPNCFNDRWLKQRIEEIRPDFPTKDKCSFHPKYKGVPIEDVAEIVDPVFRNHYGIAKYNSASGEQDGDDLHYVISELVEPDEVDLVDGDIAEVLVQQLSDAEYWDGDEPFYDDSQSYVGYEPEDYHNSYLWRNFCESIVHTQRFFNSEARQLIAELFDEIHLQKDHNKQAPVYEMNPGDPKATFYRARIADDLEKRTEIAEKPAEKLGPPPKRLRRAGRMNPAGIPCFYGAFDLKTCIAELRPAVGSIIVGAKFELARPIFVLDTTLFKAPMRQMSLFSKKYMTRSLQWKFMQSFRHEIAKPVLPSDEHLDYIPTQAVAEYLLHHHLFKGHGAPAKIEGIIYPSAQYPNGKNVVLLGDAAHVKDPTKEIKKEPKKYRPGGAFTETVESFISSAKLPEAPGLMVVDKSIKTRRISGAQYQNKAHEDYFFEPDELKF